MPVRDVALPETKLAKRSQAALGDTDYIYCGYCCQVLLARYAQAIKGSKDKVPIDPAAPKYVKGDSAGQSTWKGTVKAKLDPDWMKGTGFKFDHNNPISLGQMVDVGVVFTDSKQKKFTAIESWSYQKNTAGAEEGKKFLDGCFDHEPPLPVVVGVDHRPGSANGPVDIDHFVLIHERKTVGGEVRYYYHEVAGEKADPPWFTWKDGVLTSNGTKDLRQLAKDAFAAGKPLPSPYVKDRVYRATMFKKVVYEDSKPLKFPDPSATPPPATTTTPTTPAAPDEPKPPFAGFEPAWPVDPDAYLGAIEAEDKPRFASTWRIEAGKSAYELTQRIVCGPGVGWFPRYENGDWHPGVDIGMGKADGNLTGTHLAFSVVWGGVYARALGPGVVVAMGTQADDEYSSRYYIIEHKAGPHTFYAGYGHLHADMTFDVGDEVKAGDQLARIGPHGEYPHLYLSIVADKQIAPAALTPVAQSKDEAMGLELPQANSLMAVKIDQIGPEWGELSARRGWWAYHPVHFIQWLSGQPLDTSAQQSFLAECGARAEPISSAGGGDLSCRAPLMSDVLTGNADLQTLAANKAFKPIPKGWSKKPAVEALQKALKLLGETLGTSGPANDGVDGDWGGKTTTAITNVQTKKIPGVMSKIAGGTSPAPGLLDWTTLIGIDLLAKAAESAASNQTAAPSTTSRPPPERTQGQLTFQQLFTIMSQTFRHETGYSSMEDERLYTRCNQNTDGCGLSYGCIQFAQKPGVLGTYLKKCKERDESKLQEIFGADLQAMIDALTSASEATRMSVEAWKEPLLSKFKLLGKHQPFQQAQIILAMKNYINPWIMKAMEYGVKSPRGLAMMFDSAVQHGPARVWNRKKPDRCILFRLGEKTTEKSVKVHLKDTPQICVDLLTSTKWADHVRKRRQQILDSAIYDDAAEWVVDGELGDPPSPEAEPEQPAPAAAADETGGGTSGASPANAGAESASGATTHAENGGTAPTGGTTTSGGTTTTGNAPGPSNANRPVDPVEPDKEYWKDAALELKKGGGKPADEAKRKKFVEQLQKDLTKIGWPCTEDGAGVFGERTLLAVKRFQRAAGRIYRMAENEVAKKVDRAAGEAPDVAAGAVLKYKTAGVVEPATAKEIRNWIAQGWKRPFGRFKIRPLQYYSKPPPKEEDKFAHAKDMEGLLRADVGKAWDEICKQVEEHGGGLWGAYTGTPRYPVKPTAGSGMSAKSRHFFGVALDLSFSHHADWDFSNPGVRETGWGAAGTKREKHCKYWGCIRGRFLNGKAVESVKQAKDGGLAHKNWYIEPVFAKGTQPTTAAALLQRLKDIPEGENGGLTWAVWQKLDDPSLASKKDKHVVLGATSEKRWMDFDARCDDDYGLRTFPEGTYLNLTDIIIASGKWTRIFAHKKKSWRPSVAGLSAAQKNSKLANDSSHLEWWHYQALLEGETPSDIYSGKSVIMDLIDLAGRDVQAFKDACSWQDQGDKNPFEDMSS